MDWELSFLKPLTIEIIFRRGNVPVSICTTWVGYLGILTGMTLNNPDPVSVSVNFRITDKG